MRDAERYWLDLAELTSMHSVGSGSKLLDRGWTLFFSGVAKGVRCQAGVGILTSPRLSAAVLEFTPVDERVASLLLRAGGKNSDCCQCICTERQFGVCSLLRGPGWGPARGPSGGLRGLTGGLQHARR